MPHPSLLIRCSVALAMLLIPAACTEADPPPPADVPPPGPQQVIFLEDGTLYAADISSGERDALAEVPSGDVAVSPGGARYAAVAEPDEPAEPGENGENGENGQPGDPGDPGEPGEPGEPGDDADDGAGEEEEPQPVVLLGSLRDGTGPDETITLGPGRAPVFSPDEETVAAIVTAHGYQICTVDPIKGEEDVNGSCFIADRVRVYDAGTEAQEKQDGVTALGASRWTILGWSEGRVFGISPVGNLVALGAPGDTFEELERIQVVGPEGAFGASPTAPMVLLERRSGPFLLDLEDDTETPLDLDRVRLVSASWSPDGAVVAIVARPRRGGGASSEMSLVEVASGDARAVPDGAGARRDIHWDRRSRHFVYVRPHPQETGTMEAVVCSLELDCEPALSWERGDAVKVLGLR